MRRRTPLLQRMLRLTIWAPDGCWLWTGGRTANGYGVVGRGGRADGKALVHRAMYESLVGPIPAGLDLDHLCRVRHCANPQHLEPVTRSINLLRGDGPAITATRSRRSHCPSGHELERNPQTDRARQCRPCHRDAQRRYLASRS